MDHSSIRDREDRLILLTVNTGLRRNELQYVLEQSGAAGLALVRKFKDVSFEEELQAIRANLTALKKVFILPDDFKGLSAPTDFQLPHIPIDPDDCIGLTEASPGVTASHPEDSIEVRASTIGCALPDVEVKIVDPVTGGDLPAGREGEVITRGYHVMLGYHNKPEETKRAIRDGWLWTGDLAIMDERGYLRITGRSKDIIIRGGENIAPREIEELLLCHPAIREAYVYGVPSQFFGQEVAVAAQLKDGASLTGNELTDFCKSRIAHFKVPAYVDFVKSFPTTPSGKVQKYKLAERRAVLHQAKK